MIASNCELTFGFRPLPGQSSQSILQNLKQLSSDKKSIKILSGFMGPTLPAANQDFDQAIQKAKAIVSQYDIPIGDPVNFWTEASLFSEAGLTAFVYGPGDIAQAHTADEWVYLEQLEIVENTYIKIIENDCGD